MTGATRECRPNRIEHFSQGYRSANARAAAKNRFAVQDTLSQSPSILFSSYRHPRRVFVFVSVKIPETPPAAAAAAYSFLVRSFVFEIFPLADKVDENGFVGSWRPISEYESVCAIERVTSRPLRSLQPYVAYASSD